MRDFSEPLAGPSLVPFPSPTPPQYAQASGTPPAPPAAAIGTVSKLSGEVQVKHADGSQESLKGGGAIHAGDVITTGGGGKVGITFDDGSTFALGGNGRMSVDDVVLPSAQGLGGKESITIDSGPFSFTSGAIAKGAPDAMVLKTPVATIGVRGTTGAGVAGPEGTANTVSLLPDPDGTIGQVTVANQAGVQVLSQPGATTQVTSAFTAPPPPVILSPQQIQQQYGDTLQSLPPPPTPEQLQQMQQQRQADAQTEAEQQAQTAAAEQGEGEDAATDAAAEQQAEAEAEAVQQALGEAKTAVGDVLDAFLTGNLGNFGNVGMGEDAFAELMQGLDTLFSTFDSLGSEGGLPFDLGAQLAEFAEQLSELIDQTIEDLVDEFEDIAHEQTTNVVYLDDLGSSPYTVTTSDGVTDYIVGNEHSDDAVEISGSMGVGDTFVDYSVGYDSDTLTVDSGVDNIGWRVAGVEHVDLSASHGYDNTFLIGSSGTTFITLASGSGVDSISSGTLDEAASLLQTGEQQWTITGNLGDDNLSMGSGEDSLSLLDGGSHSATLSGIEEINFLSSSATMLTLNAGLAGVSVVGGAGNDELTLADGGNSVAVQYVETVYGGDGSDDITIDSGVSSVLAGEGNDFLTLSSVGNFGLNHMLSGGDGTDTLSIEGAAGTLALWEGTIQYIENMIIDTDAGTTTVVWSETQPGSWSSITGRDGETDILKMADSGTVDASPNDNTFDLTGIALDSIEEIHLGAGNDGVTFDDALGDGSSIAPSFTIVDNDGSGSDEDFATFYMQKAGGSLDLSDLSLTNVETVSITAVDDTGSGDEHEGDADWDGSALTIVGTDIAGVDNVVTVLSGSNVITTGQGNDTITGGDGDDTITAGSGSDQLSGGDGADVFRYTAASDFGDMIDQLDFVSGGDGDVFTFSSAALGGLSTLGAGDFAITADLMSFSFSGQHFVLQQSGGSGSLWFSASGSNSDLVQVASIDAITGTMTHEDITITA